MLNIILVDGLFPIRLHAITQTYVVFFFSIALSGTNFREIIRQQNGGHFISA